LSTREVHWAIADHCGEIAKLFKPGAKVSVIVRNPAADETEPHSAAMLVSDDNPDQIIAALEHLKKREEQKLELVIDAPKLVNCDRRLPSCAT